MNAYRFILDPIALFGGGGCLGWFRRAPHFLLLLCAMALLPGANGDDPSPSTLEGGRVESSSATPVDTGSPTTRLSPSTGRGSQATTSATTRPTTLIDQNSCVTSECHANIKSTPVVHGPVDTNACDACHELTDVSQHKYIVRRQKEALCTYCHEFSVKSMPVVHKPVADGECLGCHDPHGGKTHAIVREQSMAALCRRCHEDMAKGRHFMHSPVKDGECGSCHPPHASRFPKLVDLAGSDLCLACHIEFEPKLAATRFKHQALKDGCEKCHDVHGSNIAMSLRKEGADLCYICHDKMQATVKNATVSHSVVTKEKACLSCHSPHGSNAIKLMTDKPSVVCLKCHDKDVKRPNGTIVAAVPEIADASLMKHGALKDGQCHGCHDVHGGQRGMLLSKPYTPAFYQRFSEENYEFCFACHDKNLVKTEKTDKLTNFRNGDISLHYIHANRGDRDKNCRACHMTHAAENDRLIRSTLKYGVWQMPMRFVKTETGGSCYPGCHRAYAYDREYPVPPSTQPTTYPTARTSPPIDRAVNRDSLVVQWDAIDINGKPVTIPAGVSPMVLAVVRSDGSERDDLVARIQSCIPSDIETKLVLIVSGPNAAEEAKGIQTTAAIIADESNGATEALGIRGWPMVLVLKQDGLEVARLTGSPETIALKLPDYLRLAVGKIDETALHNRQTTQPVPADGEKQLARTLRAARILLDEEKFSQAGELLHEARVAHPESMKVRQLQVETLLATGRARDAETLLASIPVEQIAEVDRTRLFAQILIARESWSGARTLLDDAVQKFPADAEIHHLLGKVYEHDNQFKEATEQYRLASELREKK